MKTESSNLPVPSGEEVKRRILKTKRIALRLTEEDSETIKTAATKAGLTITDYLVECGKIVAEKLPDPERT